MQVLVTGPDGVLGSNLVRELLHRNYIVSVLLEPGKDPFTLNGLPIKYHLGNILDPVALDEAFRGKDIVFHCAALTTIFPARNELVNKVNIDGVKNIIEFSLKHKIKRLIYVGTANAFGYGTTKAKPGTEKDDYRSFKFGLDYMDSKYYGQLLVQEAVKNKKLPAIIVNPTFMIGPYDSRPSSGAMILALYQGKVPGFSNGGKNFVPVKDVANALANAITMGRIGECYILGNSNLSYKEAFGIIAKTIGTNAPKRRIPNSMVRAYGTINSFLAILFGYFPSITRELALISCENHFYSAEKARKELLLPQTSVEDAITECFGWFSENGYLKNKPAHHFRPSKSSTS